MFAVLKDVFASTNYRDSALKTFCKANDPTITAQKLKLPNEHERKQVLTRLARSLVENEAATRPPPHPRTATRCRTTSTPSSAVPSGARPRKVTPASTRRAARRPSTRSARARNSTNGGCRKAVGGPPDWCCSKHREDRDKNRCVRSPLRGRCAAGGGRRARRSRSVQSGHCAAPALRSIAEDAVRPLRQTLALERIDLSRARRPTRRRTRV